MGTTVKDLQEVAAKHGGSCLSTEYFNAHQLLWWECAKGHQWQARFSDVKGKNMKGGTWCRKCYDEKQKWILRRKYTIEDMRKLAKDHEGRCLSVSYINNRTPLQWECSKGHRWLAMPQHVQIRRTWCPFCSGKARLTIEEMHKLAKLRSGKCLSNEYVNWHTPLKWKCRKGHIWKACPTSIKSGGTWCPVCAKEKRGGNGGEPS